VDVLPCGPSAATAYGFRPNRSQHDALEAVIVGISSKKVNYILDADIRSFFTEVSQQWVVRFREHRIGDKRISRLVQKWGKDTKVHRLSGSIERIVNSGGEHRFSASQWPE
jgi:retron-type reverse transcriptase